MFGKTSPPGECSINLPTHVSERYINFIKKVGFARILFDNSVRFVFLGSGDCFPRNFSPNTKKILCCSAILEHLVVFERCNTSSDVAWPRGTKDHNSGIIKFVWCKAQAVPLLPLKVSMLTTKIGTQSTRSTPAELDRPVALGDRIHRVHPSLSLEC